MKALMGKNRQIFLQNDRNEVMVYLMGLKQLSHETLHHLIVSHQNRMALFASKGMHYFFCPIPDKAEIYPEDLPDGYTIHSPTPLDQIFAHLRQIGAISLDLRPLFQAAKEQHILYYQCDTHFSLMGTYCAYTHIINFVRGLCPSVLPPLDLNRDVDKIEIIRGSVKPSDIFNNFAPSPDFAAMCDTLNMSRWKPEKLHRGSPIPHYEWIEILIEADWQAFLTRYCQMINFNPEIYLAYNPDIGPACPTITDVFLHFVRMGIKENRLGGHRSDISLGNYMIHDPIIQMEVDIMDQGNTREIRAKWLDIFLTRPRSLELFNALFGANGDSFRQTYRASELASAFVSKSCLITPEPQYSGGPRISYRTINQKNPHLPSALIMHDSYYASMIPLLAENFSRAFFVWNNFYNPSIVENEKFDLVIHEVAGRFLV